MKVETAAEVESNACQEKNSNNIMAPAARARVSERLRQKQRRKELASYRKFYNSLETQAKELSEETLEYENPAHKILFLTRLGLSPISVNQVPSSLRLCKSKTKNGGSQNSSDSDRNRTSESPTSETEESMDQVDSADELDLELVVSPVDIPDLLEEVSKTKVTVLSSEMKPPCFPNSSAAPSSILIKPKSIVRSPRQPRKPKRYSSKLPRSIKNQLGKPPISSISKVENPLDLTVSNPARITKNPPAQVTSSTNPGFTKIPAPAISSTTNSSARSQPYQAPQRAQQVNLRYTATPIIPHRNIPLFCRPLMRHLPGNGIATSVTAACSNKPLAYRPMINPVKNSPYSNIPLAYRPLMKQLPGNDIPCVDLTSDDEDKDSFEALREKLLSLDTLLEFADHRR